MPMVKDKYGVWSIRSELPQNNQFYKYLVKQNNGEEIMKIDSMATRFEARPGDAAVIGDLREKRWHDGSWIGRNKRSNLFARPINIYEVHPSSWKTHPDGSPYTLKDLKRELIPYVKKYGFNGVMNYPARNFVISLLTKDDQIKAEDKFSQLVENYPSAFLKNCLNNIGTHDTERIKTILHGNENLVAIAFGLLMMLPGVPCIYYGDEAGLIGKKDPDNRRFFPWGRESEFLENTVTDLIHFRKDHLTLVDGKVGFIHVNNDINGLVRQKEDETIIFVFNKGKSEAALSENDI